MPGGEDECLQHRPQQTLQGGESQRLQLSEWGEAPVSYSTEGQEGEEGFRMSDIWANKHLQLSKGLIWHKDAISRLSW